MKSWPRINLNELKLLQVLLEKTSSSVFGAPLVGFLTRRLFDENLVSTNREKARVLSKNMFILSTFFWGMCAYFFMMMGRAEHNRKEKLEVEMKNKIGRLPSLV